MKKKISLAFILIILSIVVLGAINVSAQDEEIFRYDVKGGKVTITGFDRSISGDIEIPETIQGNPVCAIGYEAFYNATGLTSIKIPNSVTSIGRGAFSYCTNLTSVNIPDAVTAIGSSTFYNCANLKSLDIPDGVTSIGSSAFSGCSALTEVNIPDGVSLIEERTFYNCSSLTGINIPDSVISVGNLAFYGCTSMVRVDIKSLAAWCNIEFIYSESNPLVNAKNLYLNGNLVENLTIPEGITKINKFAFKNCESLKSVTFAGSVTEVGGQAFSECSSLTEVNIPESITVIENGAFYGCTALTKVNIKDIAAWCKIDFVDSESNPLGFAKNLYLNGDLVTNLTIPDGVKSISEWAFYNCTSLTDLNIPESVTHIYDGAFSDCSKLVRISFAEGLTSIGYATFYNCGALKNVVFPDSLTFISSYCFQNCTGLTSVIIPDNVSTIGFYAFHNCTGLTNVTIGNSIELIMESTFASCENLAYVCLPTSVKTISNNVFSDCPNIETVFYEGNETMWNNIQKNSGNEMLNDVQIVFNATKKTYKFDTNCNLILPDITNYALFVAPDLAGREEDFLGWYDNEACQGEPVAFPYIGNSNILYAAWKEAEAGYKINAIVVKDMSGNEISTIPVETFLATISFTNLSSSDDAVIVLAQYSVSGAFKGLMYINTEGVPIGSTIKLTLPVDNTRGDIAKLKAFCWASFGSLTPIGDSVSYPSE